MFNEALSLVCAVVAVCTVAGLVALSVYRLCERADDVRHRSRRNLRRLDGVGDEEESSRAAFVRMFLSDTMPAFVRSCKDAPVLRLFVRPCAQRLEARRAERLRESCLLDLPEMLDILSLALGAGLAFDQAFEWYLDRSDTPLAAEFRRAEQAYQVGMVSRLRAFEDVADSLQEEAVLRFVATLRQAFTLGAPLAPALDTLSRETRRYRASRLEERIAKTPVKLLVPLGACIVPAVLILLMGPIMTQVMSGLSV